MSNSPLILGTRGSDLALTQARMTRDALAKHDIDCEIKVIKTVGDKRPDLKLSEFSEKVDGVHDKGIFTKELEEALLAGEIDFAVHSLKDVPTELGEPFEICATLERAPIEDVILTTQQGIVEHLAGYDQGVYRVQSGTVQGTVHPFSGRTIATSSVRRAAQLKWVFPGVNIEDIRGNVPTRIQKLIENPDWDAIVLARAGIQRLGFYDPEVPAIDFEGTPVFTYEMPTSLFPPAASQGAVAMEVLRKNERAIESLSRINHAPTFAQITAERSFLAALKAGCQTPVGISTEFSGDGETMIIDTVVFSEENLDAAPQKAKISIPTCDASQAGTELLKALV
ncbi:MAG: hydroxymethylbilane synthase [Verrucomicrobiales bacterium]|nr:hydroxymethylbilane synthase [Verrucomicrobiales bacterium]